jgi:hypothetical protein
VLRAHCDAEGRDYDDPITKTCYFVFDVGDKGEKAATRLRSSASDDSRCTVIMQIRATQPIISVRTGSE